MNSLSFSRGEIVTATVIGVLAILAGALALGGAGFWAGYQTSQNLSATPSATPTSTPGCTTTTGPDLLVNGNFNQGQGCTNPSHFPGSTAMPGWTVIDEGGSGCNGWHGNTACGLGVVDGYAFDFQSRSSSPNQSCYNSPVTGIGIKQTITTVPGKTYRIQFSIQQGDSVPAGSGNSLNLYLNGSLHQTFTYPPTLTGFAQQATNFTATATSTEIKFVNWGNIYPVNGIDEISLKEVSCGLAAPPTPTISPGATTAVCSDSLDNDSDARIDSADPACHPGDRNADNAASYVPSHTSEVDTQCSDKADNDADNKVDALDPGCHSDRNPDNPATYNPADNDESDSGSDATPTPTSTFDPGGIKEID